MVFLPHFLNLSSHWMFFNAALYACAIIFPKPRNIILLHFAYDSLIKFCLVRSAPHSSSGVGAVELCNVSSSWTGFLDCFNLPPLFPFVPDVPPIAALNCSCFLMSYRTSGKNWYIFLKMVNKKLEVIYIIFVNIKLKGTYLDRVMVWDSKRQKSTNF